MRQVYLSTTISGVSRLACWGPRSRTSSAMHELPRSFLDCWGKLLVPGTHAVGTVRGTHVTSRTAVDVHELFVVVDPHQQVSQAPNARQRCDGSCSAHPPPLVVGRSLDDRWLPALLPIKSDSAHQPLQTSLSLVSQLAVPADGCHSVHMTSALVHWPFAA